MAVRSLSLLQHLCVDVPPYGGRLLSSLRLSFANDHNVTYHYLTGADSIASPISIIVAPDPDTAGSLPSH